MSAQTTDAAAPAATATEPISAYRVLARKYRPQTFADLIGQDAMVRTLTNAFETGRIPQAWILTGVRGVGKTTTARILARALNYQLPDGSGAPTIQMPALGVHCQAIMESRHIDVLEMDAASHNGVDDVRQINDAIRYAPVSARYKVYILDEVHMLSASAFNALLKTLEEPPPHAKFIFATTEVRKVPVTVLSRCQRFDLRRVDAGLLTEHMETIARRESISVEPEALALIARAAEGSVRDALSLFDQASVHAHSGDGRGVSVRSEDVRQLLGLADRVRIVDLFEATMRGDIAGALAELRDQYDAGADPAVVLADLAEFTHFVTRVKIVPQVADDRSLAEAERLRGREFAARLPIRVLSRTWQMLLRGLAEVQAASKPIAAAEMVLVRITHAADLPTPDEVIRNLEGVPAAGTRTIDETKKQLARSERHEPASISGAGSPPPATADSTRGTGREGSWVADAFRQANPPFFPTRASSLPEKPPAAPLRGGREKTVPVAYAMPLRAAAAEAEPPAAVSSQRVPIGRFEDLVALAQAKRDLHIQLALERDVHLVRFEDGQIEIALEPGASKSLVQELSGKLSEWTGRRWLVAVSTDPGGPTLAAQRELERSERERGVRGDPLVQAVLGRFPGAQILDVRRREAEGMAGALAADRVLDEDVSAAAARRDDGEPDL
jgi:DNA polymerase III subunit gamma/tau